MLENDLKIRNQFASKIINKVKKINDDIKLLSKVDKQLLKNINKKGGDIENFNINKIGGSPTDDERQILFAQNQLKIQKLEGLKSKFTKIKADKEANDAANINTDAANKASLAKLTDIIQRLEKFIESFDTLNQILADFEIPELEDMNFTKLNKVNTADIDRLNTLIPKDLKIYTTGEIATATSSIDKLKKEYILLVKKQIPKYTFIPTSSGDNDYTKDVIWNDTTTIVNLGGAYYTVLEKLLADDNLKYTFSKDKLDFIHRKLNITAPDETNPDIKLIIDAKTYLNQQEAFKEAQENIKKESQLVLKDPSKSSDHAAANANIAAADAQILLIDQLIVIAEQNYKKLIGTFADTDIDAKNTQILAQAETVITNNDTALQFLNTASGNLATAIAAAAAAAASPEIQAILNALNADPSNAVINLQGKISKLSSEFDTATAIDALRKAIRDNPDDNNTTISSKINPPISAAANTIITSAIAAATDTDPRNVLTTLKSKLIDINMVGGGRSSRRNSSRTSRHDSSRTSRYDSSSTSRHSGW